MNTDLNNYFKRHNTTAEDQKEIEGLFGKDNVGLQVKALFKECKRRYDLDIQKISDTSNCPTWGKWVKGRASIELGFIEIDIVWLN